MAGDREAAAGPRSEWFLEDVDVWIGGLVVSFRIPPGAPRRTDVGR